MIAGNSSIARSFHFRRLVVALACTAVVLSLTHIPGEAIPRVFSIGGFDKLIHCTAYAVIAASFLFAVDRRAGWRLPVILVLGILALGAVDELTQPFVRRTCSGWDFVADMIGVAIACGIWRAASARRKAVSVRAAEPSGSVLRQERSDRL